MGCYFYHNPCPGYNISGAGGRRNWELPGPDFSKQKLAGQRTGVHCVSHHEVLEMGTHCPQSLSEVTEQQMSRGPMEA